jgi:hypothetical protein
MNLTEIDYIHSGLLDEIVAKVQISKNGDSEYFFSAKILEFNFPEKLVFLISEYWSCVDDFSMSLSDEFEEEIAHYGLKLLNSNQKIFRVEFKDDLEVLTFFTKYPTATGFRDDFF